MKYKAIEDAFLRLPLLADTEFMLQTAVNKLACMNSRDTSTFSSIFAPAGRKKTMRELEKLARPNSNIEKLIQQLHQPAILALSNHGYNRGDPLLPDRIRAIAARAAQSDLSWVPDKIPGGRRQNKLAHVVAQILAGSFKELTGQDPFLIIDSASGDSTPYGPFFDLVRDVFAALGIEVSVEHFAKEAFKEFKKKQSYKGL